MNNEQARPEYIPAHAQNVTSLPHGLWLWEFSGGAVLFVHQERMGLLRLEGKTLEALLAHVAANQERYREALAAERARQAAYEDYLRGVDYEPDEDDYEFDEGEDSNS